MASTKLDRSGVFNKDRQAVALSAGQTPKPEVSLERVIPPWRQREIDLEEREEAEEMRKSL